MPKPMMKTRHARHGEARDFIASAVRSSTDECILWPFAQNGYGYGMVCVGKIRKGAYREVCEQFYGPCPPGLRDAAHRCGNRLCINPRHLYWAARSGNCMDRVIHGTANRGEKHGKVRLTEQQVRKLRIAYRAGENISGIARQWGVNVFTATNAATGRNWKWLEDHDL